MASRPTIDPEHEARILEALDELHDAEEAARDIKLHLKACKAELEDCMAEAGLERGLVINGRLVSAKTRPSAEEGPLFNGNGHGGGMARAGEIAREMRDELAREGVSMTVSTVHSAEYDEG